MHKIHCFKLSSSYTKVPLSLEAISFLILIKTMSKRTFGLLNCFTLYTPVMTMVIAKLATEIRKQ